MVSFFEEAGFPGRNTWVHQIHSTFLWHLTIPVVFPPTLPFFEKKIKRICRFCHSWKMIASSDWFVSTLTSTGCSWCLLRMTTQYGYGIWRTARVQLSSAITTLSSKISASLIMVIPCTGWKKIGLLHVFVDSSICLIKSFLCRQNSYWHCHLTEWKV